MASYTEKDKKRILDTVCERLSNGEALRKVLKKDGMPTMATFISWVDNDDKKLNQYIHAREAREDFIFEEILDIADETKNDISVISLGDNVEVEKVNNEAIQRSRLRVDTRKWMLGKMNSTKYGDKIHQELSGEVKTGALTGDDEKRLIELAKVILEAQKEKE